MRRAVLWIAGGLALVPFLLTSACDLDADDTLAASRPDAAADVGLGDQRAPALDAGSDVEVDAAPCVSTFTVTSDCRHPAVVRTCVGGFCKIPPGCFVMGAPECQFGRGLRDENEVQVTITRAFEIEQYETDQADWVAAGFPNPSRVDEGRSGDYGDCLEPNCPVGHVTWFEALAYANRRSETAGLPHCYVLGACSGDVGTGMKCDEVSLTSPTLYECAGYRLPTEAAWEYAVRACRLGTVHQNHGAVLLFVGRFVHDPKTSTADEVIETGRVVVDDRDRATVPIEGGQHVRNDLSDHDRRERVVQVEVRVSVEVREDRRVRGNDSAAFFRDAKPREVAACNRSERRRELDSVGACERVVEHGPKRSALAAPVIEDAIGRVDLKAAQ